MSESKALTVAQKKDALAKQMDGWAMDLLRSGGPKFTPDRLQMAALTAAIQNPAIFECTPRSLYLALMKCARWKLDIGDGVYLVPFRQNQNKGQGPPEWISVCEAVPDYRGLKALAMRQNLIRGMDEAVVYKGDEFMRELGLEPRLRHVPCREDKRGPIVGAYSIITLRYGARTFHYMDIEDIEKRRAKSQSWSPKKGFTDPLPWYCMKTVVRDYLNRQPKSGALAEALDSDDTQEIVVDSATGEIIRPPEAKQVTDGKKEESTDADLDEQAGKESGDL